MQRCKLRKGEPCIQYDQANPDALTSFVKANGGPLPIFRKDGTADVITMIKGREKTVFVRHGFWLRSMQPTMFSAHSEEFFLAKYELVSEKPANCAKVCGIVPKPTPMHAEAIAQILDK